MRKNLFSCLILAVLCIVLSGCRANTPENNQLSSGTHSSTDPAPTQTQPTQTESPAPADPAEPEDFGLLYALNESGESYRVTGWKDSCPESLVIPAEYDGKPVTVIETLQFGPFSSVEIPESVVTIEAYAFSCCDKLTSVTVPGNVKEIQRNAFQGCQMLESVTVCDGVERIGFYAFGECPVLTSVDLPDGGYVFVEQDIICNTPIYADASNWDSGVLYWDNYLLTVDTEAFSASYTGDSPSFQVRENTVCVAERALDSGAFFIREIVMPDSLVYIADYGFLGCYPDTLTIPSGVRYIGDHAFCCYYVTHLNIQEGVEYIGTDAFSSCNSLTSITFPASLRQLSVGSFTGESINQLSVREGNPVYHSTGNCIIETATGTLIQGCNASTIPDDGSITAIGPQAFANLRSIKLVTVPEGVTVIGQNAFDYCTVEQLSLPQSLERIEDNAFLCCKKLTSLTIPANVVYIGNNAFADCTHIEELTFENINGWSRGSEAVDLHDTAAVLPLLIEYAEDAAWIRS